MLERGGVYCKRPRRRSNKGLLLTGEAARSGALAWRLALRVGIVVLQQKPRVVRQRSRNSSNAGR